MNLFQLDIHLNFRFWAP